jgi:thioredoxin-dependent peroxiredoxin
MSKKTRKKTSNKAPSKALRKSPKKTAKKTTKKSAKPSPGKVARAPSKARATTASAKTGQAAAIRPGKNAEKHPANAAPGASHKAPLKPLKPPVPSESAPRPSALAEGAKAPAFRLPRDGGELVSLADYAGRRLVLFFYPRADTPGCTREAIDFTRLAAAFAQSQTAVLGVSADPLKAQEAFRDKHELSVPLVSDERHEMLEAYGVWGEKSMYGRTFQGILRTTVLIGGDGRIIRIWRNVRVDGHADEVLAAVRSG